jgi:peptidoglycan L-alanyl-D-glutamate endopeptidase CwlK
LTCTFRSHEEQNALYAQGRSTGKLGAIVTNARAGQSPHNFKPALAGDVAFVKPNKVLDWNPKLFMDLFAIMQKKFPDKIIFGGNFKFKDFPHYELKNWKTL